MTFPVYLEGFGLRLHPHAVCEAAAYFIGARIYFCQRRGEADATAAWPLETRLWLLVGCLFGAWAGSKLLAWVESPTYYFGRGFTWFGLIGGKTIVGGVLGGWAGVEIAKRAQRLTDSTGDGFVLPLAVGTAIGRIGCFLTGLSDHTHGVATTLPWGVDLGDGVRRHPTALYESAFAATCALLWVVVRRRTTLPPGAGFRLYVAVYLGFRFLIEFLKPRETPVAGLSAIQIASLLGFVFALRGFQRLLSSRLATRPPA